MVDIFSAIAPTEKNYAPATPHGRGGWLPWSVKEPFSGAWQRNIEYKREDCLQNPTAFACVSLISSDISKLPPKMVRESNGIWNQIPFGNYSVVNQPNAYQNRIQFYQQWITSLLCRGNTYVLKGRDSRGNVTRLYILHPDRVLPVVSDSGDIFYQLSQDNLAGITEVGTTVPASEIIHDRINCFYHPLVGLPPLYAACCVAGMTNTAIHNSSTHFGNMSRPSGILTAPGAISDDVATRLKEHWEKNYSGDNYGKTAVLGDDLKYQPITTTAVENQLIEQLRWNAEQIAAVFHVPFYMVGGPYPSYNNVEALNQQYYGQCLQIYIESMEECLDRGLDIQEGQGIEFDLDVLLRMDSKTQVETLSAAIKGGLDTPNEARKRRNQKPLEGGDTVWLQQQQYPMEVLANRRAPDDDVIEDVIVEEPINDEPQERNISAVMLKMMKNRENMDYAV